MTRIPVGGFPFSDEEWRNASAYFPWVGLFVGGLLAGCLTLTAPLGVWPSCVLTIALGAWITGALHEDGLADTADALGGSAHAPGRLLEILKDSRIGSFGATALILSITLRLALLVELGERAPIALVLAHTLSRIPPVWQMATLSYVSEPHRARSGGITQGGPPQAWLATALGVALLVAALFFGWISTATPALLVGLLLAVGFYTGWRYQVRAGGFTGDFLGATQQLSEAAVLAGCVLAGSAS